VPPDGNPNPWSDYLLGWRFEFHLEPLSVIGEGPLDGFPGWRQGVVLLPHEGSLVVGEVKLFPDGDRRKAASERDTLRTEVHLGMWSHTPEALNPESPTVTAKMLRSVSLPEIVQAVQRQWASDMGRNDQSEWEKLLGEKPSAIAAEFVRSVDLDRHPVGRPRSDKAARRDLELATIASLYAEAMNDHSTAPIKEVTRRLGLDPENPQDRRYVRDAKFRAADKGYLEGTQERRAGGRLTKKAIEILEAAAKEQA
jgi:hypothetical protein